MNKIKLSEAAKKLDSKGQKQWSVICQAISDKCNDQVKASEVADFILAEKRKEAISWIVTSLSQGKAEVKEAVVDLCFRLSGSDLAENFDLDTPENIVIEGQEVQLLESTSYLTEIKEDYFPVDIKDASLPSSVVEATKNIDDKNPLVVYKAIQGKSESSDGISKNKNFYSGELAEGLVPHLENRRKMYLDHAALGKWGRATIEWASTIQEAWANAGASFVLTRILRENPHTGWIWEAIKNHPDELGVSINAFVRGRKGKIQGQEVFLVEEWAFLYSLDHVSDPSAGGIFMGFGTGKSENNALAQTQESHVPSMKTLPANITEAINKSLKDMISDAKRAEMLWMLGSITMRFIRRVASDKDATDEEKNAAIEQGIKDFAEEVKMLDPVGFYNSMRSDEDGWVYASTDYTQENARILGTTILDLRALSDLRQEGWEEINKPEFIFKGIPLKKMEKSVSKKPWKETDIDSLTSESFFVVGDPDNKTTWHLPYKNAKLETNYEAIEGIASALLNVSEDRSVFLPKEVVGKIRTEFERCGLSEALVTGTKSGTETKPSQENKDVDPEELKKLSLEQIVLAHPGVAAKLSESAKAVESKNSELETAKAELKTAREEIEASKKAAEATQKTVADLQAKEEARAQSDLVESCLSASTVLDRNNPIHCSESFKKRLAIAAKEGKEAVEAEIKDHEALVSQIKNRPAPSVGNGAPKTTAPTNAAENVNAFEGSTVVDFKDDDALVAGIAATY